MSDAEIARTCPMCGAVAEANALRCPSCGEGLSTLSEVAGQQTPDKLFSPAQIALAAFLGAPLAACWILSRNFRVLGQSRSATHCLLWGALGTAAILGISYFLPDGFPNMVIPIGYTVGLYQAAQKMQGDVVARHISRGGRLGSWWTVVGVSLICLVLIVGALFGVLFLFLPDE